MNPLAPSILDALAAKAAPLVAGDAAWVDTAAVVLRSRVEPYLPALGPSLSGGAAAFHAAVDELVAQKDLIGQVSAHGFAALTLRLAENPDDEPARLLWLATVATFDEAMAELDAAYVATRQDAAQKAAEWETVKGIILAILEAGGKAAIPVLLSLVAL